MTDPHLPPLPLDYRAIGLAPHATDIIVFFVDLAQYGVLDAAGLRLLDYLAEGRSTHEIADALGCSPRTTNRRIAALRDRLHAYAYATN